MTPNLNRICVVVLTTALLSACTTNPFTGEQELSNKAYGAAIGAAAGAAIGALSGDDNKERRKRALIGAGIGALAGTAVGAYMDAQEAKLRQQLADTGVSVTRVGDDIVLNMPGNVTFPVNQSAIRGSFYPVLDSVGLVLEEYEKTMIDVIGHTDSTGSFEYNMDLSQGRALSVSQYLESQGVDRVRVVARGVGEQFPIADNDTSRGRQQNRRVELVLRPVTA